MDLAKDIGQRLKQAREEARLTQEELASNLGIGRAAVANIETGRSLITVDHLLNLPKILHKPAAYFLGISDGLANDEAELLELFRALPPGLPRELVLDLLRTLVQRLKEGGEID